MPDGDITVSVKNDVALLTLSRPERKNAFNQAMFRALDRAVEVLTREAPRAVVVTGEPCPVFCAGMDVNPDNPHVESILSAVTNNDSEPVRELIRDLRSSVDGLFALPMPIIAALNGPAYGGGAELATRCDLRVMDPSAGLRFSEVSMGLMPDWGGGVALTRVLGTSRAADLILTARMVKAEEAFALGLANRVSEPGKSLEQALALARGIAENGPLAVASALCLIRRVPDLSEEQALDLEAELAIRLIAGGECAHGVAAFLARQKPVFPDPRKK